MYCVIIIIIIIIIIITGNSINIVPSQLLLYATIATVSPVTNYGLLRRLFKYCLFLVVAVSSKMFAR